MDFDDREEQAEDTVPGTGMKPLEEDTGGSGTAAADEIVGIDTVPPAVIITIALQESEPEPLERDVLETIPEELEDEMTGALVTEDVDELACILPGAIEERLQEEALIRAPDEKAELIDRALTVISADDADVIEEKVDETAERPEDILAESPAALFLAAESAALPESYDEDLLVILIRDPYKAFAYWDFSPGQKELLGLSASEEAPSGQLYLKIYKGLHHDDLMKDPQLHLELPILPEVHSCYFELDESFEAYYGTMEFVPFFSEPVTVSSSNIITPPRASLSDDFEGEWKAVEKIYQRFYSLVRKEIQNDVHFKEIMDEDIREIIARDEIEDQKETALIAQRMAEEMREDPGLSTEEIVTRVEARKAEIRHEQQMEQKAMEEWIWQEFGIPAEELIRQQTYVQQITKQQEQRQKILRRLVAAYLEKRALPGGIYSSALHHFQLRDSNEGLTSA